MTATRPVASGGPRKNSGVRFGAGCLIAVSIPFFLMASAAFIVGKDLPSGFWTLLVALFFAGGGFLWLKSVIKREKLVVAHHQERQVLNVAAATGGSTTAVEVCQMTQMNIDEAEAAIQRLCSSGHATTEIDDDGAVIYHFSGLHHTQN